jgi:hypothetical protein
VCAGLIAAARRSHATHGPSFLGKQSHVQLSTVAQFEHILCVTLASSHRHTPTAAGLIGNAEVNVRISLGTELNMTARDR